jgi:hypothetical protein
LNEFVSTAAKPPVPSASVCRLSWVSRISLMSACVPPNGEPIGLVGSMPIVSGAPALVMSMKSVVIPIRPRGSSAKTFTLARAAERMASFVASMISLPLGELKVSAMG